MDKKVLLDAIARGTAAAATAKTLAITFGAPASEKAMRECEAYLTEIGQQLGMEIEEEEQKEIAVGDVVIMEGKRGKVTRITDCHLFADVTFDDGTEWTEAPIGWLERQAS